MKRIDISDFKNTMSRGARRCGTRAKRHLPEILFVAGTAFIFKGLYEAGKAGVKWENEYSQTHEDNLDYIEMRADQEIISEHEAIVETGKEYGYAAIDWSKCWAKSLIFTSVGIITYGAGFKILKDENRDLKNGLFDIALATAAYRGRVREYVGEDKEYDLFHNIKREIVEEEYIDENGKKKKRKVEKIVNEGEQVRGDHNSYFFGQGDDHFNDMVSNDFFIRSSEMMFNRMLVGRGDGGKMEKDEVLRHFRWDENDSYPLEAIENGWIYLERERDNYEYPYPDDPYLPRIVKLTTSKDFGISTGETWVDLNCYPLKPILEKLQKAKEEERLAARNGKYIPMTV